MQDASRERDERDLQEVFDLAARADSGGEADHAYLCALTMEPFRDPVTTPDGNSYERSALLEHLRQVRGSSTPARTCKTMHLQCPPLWLRSPAYRLRSACERIHSEPAPKALRISAAVVSPRSTVAEWGKLV